MANTLPTLSKNVLVMLAKMLERQDPGFSDVIADDIAAKLKISGQTVGGALSHLTKEGLVEVEEWNGNRRRMLFLHLTDAGKEAVEEIKADEVRLIIEDDGTVHPVNGFEVDLVSLAEFVNDLLFAIDNNKGQLAYEQIIIDRFGEE